jgi:anaerobic selenocysteine-containing dehydrogenase
MNVQVRIGGDMALLRGVAKAVFEAAEGNPAVIDREFIEHCTRGFTEYRAIVDSTPLARSGPGLRRCRGRHSETG